MTMTSQSADVWGVILTECDQLQPIKRIENISCGEISNNLLITHIILYKK